MHTIEKALTPGSPYFPSVTELERATTFLAREIGELEELLVDAVEDVRWQLPVASSVRRCPLSSSSSSSSLVLGHRPSSSFLLLRVDKP